MSNLCRGDVVSQSGIDLAGASVAVIWMPSKLTERSCEASSYSSITRGAIRDAELLTGCPPTGEPTIFPGLRTDPGWRAARRINCQITGRPSPEPFGTMVRDSHSHCDEAYLKPT